MIFKNNALATVHSTNTDLDGACVRVVGVARDFTPLPGTIYVIERIDGEKFNGWKTLVLTESCLTPLGGSSEVTC